MATPVPKDQEKKSVMKVERFSPEEKEKIWQEIWKMRRAITKGGRFRSIAGVLAKHGLLYLLMDRRMFWWFPGKKTTPEEDQELHRLGRRLRLAFEELGPTFIKLGQVLVTRQELIPGPVTEELAKLLDEVPPMPFQYMAYVMDDELPEGLATFAWIDTDPIGSASLAQVYRARLKNGRMCAVKVVRPHVGKLFQTDIAVIRKFARRVHKLLPPEWAAAVDLPGLVDDYYSSSMNELDMRAEARNMREHDQLGEEFETIGVPEVYHATPSVLVMEYVDGWNLKEFPVDFLSFEERFERMMDLAHYYIKTFTEGYYHADPHGSNLLLDRHTKKVIGIDWGMVGRLDALHTEAIFRMLLHIRLNQAEDAAEAALDIVQQTPYTDPVRLKDEIRTVFIRYVNSEQGSHYNWGNLLIQAITVAMRNYCRIPNGLALWAKGFAAAEGTARWLCPEISYHVVLESADVQILRRWLGRRFNYRANAGWITETAKLVATFPRRINKVLEKLAWNDWKWVVVNRLDDDSAHRLNRMVNRLTLGMMASGMFMGSSLLLSLGGEQVLSVPSLRWLASGMLWGSALLALYVVWRVLRYRR